MALSSSKRNQLIDLMNTTFDSIGHSPGMNMPKNSANNAEAAWNYYVAKHLLSRAQKSKDDAEKKALEAGVLIDKKKDARVPGQHGPIYNNGDVVVTLEVKKGPERVDVDTLVSYLVLKGVKAKLIEEAVEKATKQFDPSYTFTPVLMAATPTAK